VEIGASIAQSDAGNLFQFAALISINLRLSTFCPTSFDGGQAFLLIEGLRGKPLPTNIQDGVMQTGLMVLLGLGLDCARHCQPGIGTKVVPVSITRVS